MSTAAVANDIKLQLHRTYKATPQQIFEAWTRPELVQQWFGLGTHSILSVVTDPRSGGEYRISLEGPMNGELTVSTVNGTYTVVDPYSRLAFTWNASWSPNEESLVTVVLKPVDGGTELLLTHERFLTEQSRDAHNYGWTASLDRIQQLFA